MKYLIIGAGAAGVSAAKEIIRRREEDDEIIINGKDWFEKNDINLKLNEKVTEVKFDGKKVITDKENYGYDKLLLANGAHPFIPPIKGIEKKNVFALRNLSDAKKICKKAENANDAVVIGGGLLGVEAASNLKKNGLEVTVIERANWCLNRQLDENGGELLVDILKREKGLRFKLDASTEEFLGDDKVQGVLLGDGTKIKADLVLLSTGVRSNIGLFENTDLKINNAVVVDKYMKTNIDDVYAAGDIAEHDG